MGVEVIASSAGGTSTAAAMAAEQQRRLEEEEEQMTRYGSDDVEGDWEFKILRSNSKAFRKPEVLAKVCAEEARAGWTLVEKFDDRRLRFKRPQSARAADAALGVDPYRTQYGMSDATQAVLIVAGILAALLLAAVLAFVIVAPAARPAPPPRPVAAPAVKANAVPAPPAVRAGDR